jgi:lipoprotein-anchoring transpeptidase ErfK/SrfK
LDAAGLYHVARKLEPNNPPRSTQAAPAQDTAELANVHGDRALYLSRNSYVIHSTTSTRSVGRIVRGGCFQIIERDFVDLFNRIAIGARVVLN